MHPEDVELAIEAHAERQYALVSSLARLFMVNVSDETVGKFIEEEKARAEGREPVLPPDEAEKLKNRSHFMHSLLDPATPLWRIEARERPLDEAEPEEPIPDLPPEIARAWVEGMRSKTLPEQVRQSLYRVWGRVLATAELARLTAPSSLSGPWQA